MERIEAAVLAVNRAVVAAALAAGLAIVMVNVVGRYLFASSFAWVEEAARHLMIFGAFCGAGLALREGRLVAITLLADLLPGRINRALRWGMVLLMATIMATLMWLGIEFVRFGWNKETVSTGVSRAVPYLAVPLGCALFLVQLAFFARRFVAAAFEGEADHTGDHAAAQSPGGTN